MTQLGARCASFLIACLLAAAAAVPHAASAEHTHRKTGADAQLLRHGRYKSRRLMQVHFIDHSGQNPLARMLTHAAQLAQLLGMDSTWATVQAELSCR